ncbi:MAG TPA: hypothetical protein VEZ11_09995 [Thermoanaerobaculia bacterium]|nr:hypothetical protein [Thermoanaerobaculia bacterium]
MTMAFRRASLGAICFLLVLGVAFASWYDDYDDGVKAARAGKWQVVVQKMTSAIAAKGKENSTERTYGAIFINYHPYYYRAVANLNLGKYEQAISDLEKTSGPGELDLGPIETLMQRAKSKLEAQSAPPEPQPSPVPQPSRGPAPQQQPPPLPVPAAPVMDPALRQRADGAVATAQKQMEQALGRKASTNPNYGNGLQSLAQARTRVATAKTNDDLNQAIALANNAGMFFDAATPPGVAPAPPPRVQPVPQPSRQTSATSTILAEDSTLIRKALSDYFAGEFESASRQFTDLSIRQPKNAWIWAFLGASQYSLYAFEANEAYKSQALDSFRRAKVLRKWDGGLPQKYFSKRIRKVFQNAG